MVNADRGDVLGDFLFFFQAEDGIRDHCVTGVQTCALPISCSKAPDRVRGAPLIATSDLGAFEQVAAGGVKLGQPLAVTCSTAGLALPQTEEIGRASCRERV